MIKTSTWSMSVAALAGSLALMTFAASAQTTTTAPVAPAAPKAAAPAAPAAKTTVAPKVAPVVCKGRDEASCKTEATACGWIVPTKVEANGKVDKAYCRKVAGVAKKAADAKKATSDALAKAGAAAKTAVAAPAATTPVAPAKK